jgi:hypothetical protein
MTEYTGFHGTLTLGAVPIVVLAEFSVKVGRSEATHPRSGEESDISVPGKLSASGTIQRIQDDAELLQHVLDGDLFELVGKLTKAAKVITVTVEDAYMTSGEFKFTHAGEVASDNATFAIHDVSALNPAIVAV